MHGLLQCVLYVRLKIRLMRQLYFVSSIRWLRLVGEVIWANFTQAWWTVAYSVFRRAAVLGDILLLFPHSICRDTRSWVSTFPTRCWGWHYRVHHTQTQRRGRQCTPGTFMSQQNGNGWIGHDIPFPGWHKPSTSCTHPASSTWFFRALLPFF